MKEPWALRAIVFALSLIALISTSGAVTLSLMNRAVPQLLMALGSVSVGALVTLLVLATNRRL